MKERTLERTLGKFSKGTIPMGVFVHPTIRFGRISPESEDDTEHDRETGENNSTTVPGLPDTATFSQTTITTGRFLLFTGIHLSSHPLPRSPGGFANAPFQGYDEKKKEIVPGTGPQAYIACIGAIARGTNYSGGCHRESAMGSIGGGGTACATTVTQWEEQPEAPRQLPHRLLLLLLLLPAPRQLPHRLQHPQMPLLPLRLRQREGQAG